MLVADHDLLSPLQRAKAQVEDNIRLAGEVLLGEVPQDAGITAARSLEPAAIIDTVEASGLRGCGGAGFTSGRKWRFAAAAPDPHKVVICNADEGEPGTFKDRVLLTNRADLVIEGMAICARAIGAAEGILYLRGEYVYLRDHLEDRLAAARDRGVLDGFDIRIQLGAGAYVCGEEGR